MKTEFTNGRELGNLIIGRPKKEYLKGAEKLRKIVEWLNNRPEHLNNDKGHIELIIEYNRENEKG